MWLPVTSVQFARSEKFPAGAFRVNLLWRANISTLLMVACRRGEAMDIDGLLAHLRLDVRPDSLNAQIFPKGGDAYDFCPSRLAGQWVDIYAVDCDMAGNALFHDGPRTLFFGHCVVGYQIKVLKNVSSSLKCAVITIENQSAFGIPAYSLGYRVGSELYGIPFELKQRERLTLPQIEIPCEQHLLLSQMPDGLPVIFNPAI